MQEFRAPDWDSYRMSYREPFRQLEPPQHEIAIVQQALGSLAAAGILHSTEYAHERFAQHREAVRKLFEIPWTAISPRVERLMYAINAIAQPQNMVAAGVFCGNTFISNAGAAVGPGARYQARHLVGVEIKPHEAARAERNVRKLDPSGVARIVAADAVDVCAGFPEPIHLLYLDADGTPEKGKGIYLDILLAAYDKMPPGAIVLAHNSVNSASRLRHYLEFVRDTANFRASVNCILDPEGLEVSAK